MSIGEKPRLVFVPGLGANGAVYKPFLDALRSEYDVRSADLPVRFPKALSWSFFFAPIDRAAGSGPVILVGHSMGGGIALKYAASHQRRVARTVVVSPVLFPSRPGRIWTGLSKYRWYRYLRSAAIGLAAGHPMHLRRVTQARKRILADGRRRQLYDWVHHMDLTKDLPKLRTASVLWPEQEELIDPVTRDRLLREFPNVPVRSIPGSHNTLALNPRRLVPIIRKEIDV